MVRKDPIFEARTNVKVLLHPHHHLHPTYIQHTPTIHRVKLTRLAPLKPTQKRSRPRRINLQIRKSKSRPRNEKPRIPNRPYPRRKRSP